MPSRSVGETSPRIDGQVALVTGGGRGIGRAIAQTLAAAGACVAVLARSQAELDETVSLIEQDGGKAHASVADVTDAAAITAAIRRTEDLFGPISVLVNNAATGGPIGPFWETSASDWLRAVEINLFGPVLCAQAVLPGMIARQQGRIINIATSAIPVAYFSSYSTSKTALVRFTETVTAELAPHGVKMFSLVPGTIRTAMSERSLDSAEGRRWLPWFRTIFAEGLDVPAERPARMVLDLASGRADSLSGCLISIADDLDALVKNQAVIRENRLLSLRVRTLDSPVSPVANTALASIRAEAECARPRTGEVDRCSTGVETTSTADADQPLTVMIERNFGASAKRVFQAWIDPKAVEQWFVHNARVHWKHSPSIVPKPGGEFHWSVQSNDNPRDVFTFHGTYRELEVGASLAFTWEWQTLPIEGVTVPGKTLVTIRFVPQGDSTKLVLLHTALPNEGASTAHDKGWRRCLEGIACMFRRSGCREDS